MLKNLISINCRPNKRECELHSSGQSQELNHTVSQSVLGKRARRGELCSDNCSAEKQKGLQLQLQPTVLFLPIADADNTQPVETAFSLWLLLFLLLCTAVSLNSFGGKSSRVEMARWGEKQQQKNKGGALLSDYG